MSGWFRWQDDDLLLSLRVVPRASRDEMLAEPGRLRVRITAPPVEGAANNHLIGFLAREFGLGRARVSLVRGHSSRDKLVRILAPSQLPDALAHVGVARVEQKHRKN